MMLDDELKVSEKLDVFTNGTWTCKKCTYDNDNCLTTDIGHFYCLICFCWSTDESLWGCPVLNCGAPNTNKRVICENCGKRRPSAPVNRKKPYDVCGEYRQRAYRNRQTRIPLKRLAEIENNQFDYTTQPMESNQPCKDKVKINHEIHITKAEVEKHSLVMTAQQFDEKYNTKYGDEPKNVDFFHINDNNTHNMTKPENAIVDIYDDNDCDNNEYMFTDDDDGINDMNFLYPSIEDGLFDIDESILSYTLDDIDATTATVTATTATTTTDNNNNNNNIQENIAKSSSSSSSSSFSKQNMNKDEKIGSKQDNMIVNNTNYDDDINIQDATSIIHSTNNTKLDNMITSVSDTNYNDDIHVLYTTTENDTTYTTIKVQSTCITEYDISQQATGILYDILSSSMTKSPDISLLNNNTNNPTTNTTSTTTTTNNNDDNITLCDPEMYNSMPTSSSSSSSSSHKNYTVLKYNNNSEKLEVPCHLKLNDYEIITTANSDIIMTGQAEEKEIQRKKRQMKLVTELHHSQITVFYAQIEALNRLRQLLPEYQN